MLDTVFFSHELLPALNRGLLVSLALIIPAGSLGFVGGVLIGCMRTFGPRWLRRLGDWYTAILRGVPLAVQLSTTPCPSWASISHPTARP